MGPVTVGSLIQRSLVVFRAGFFPFASLAFIFYFPVALLRLVTPAPEPTPADLFSASNVGLFLLAHVLLIPIATAAIVYGVFEGLRGRSATISQCISVATSRWMPILGLAILTVITVGLGFLLFIIPGIVLTYGLFVAGPVLIVEKLDPISAMRRSWQLTDGYKQSLFLLALIIGILQLAATLPLTLAFSGGSIGSEAPPTNLHQLLEGFVIVVFTAFNAIAAGVAYHDLRGLREGLDDELDPVPKHHFST